jgi:hypothetical protein
VHEYVLEQATNMNQYSSRSHAIFQLIITQTTLIRSKSSAMDRTVRWLAAVDAAVAASQRHARVLWLHFRREFDSLPRAPPFHVHLPSTCTSPLGVQSRVSMVDLAGSERATKAGEFGDRLAEAQVCSRSYRAPQYHSTTVPLYTLAAEKLLTFLRVWCCMHCWCLVAEHQQVLDNARASHLCPR